MKYFYWAAVGTAFLINIGYTITSLMHQYHNRPSITSCIIQLSNHKCSIPSDTSVYNDEVLTLAAIFGITPVAVITELLISACVAKNNDNMMQEKVGCRCSSLKQYLLLSVNVSTRIVEYSDHLTTFSTTAIPLCVLLLIYSQVTCLCNNFTTTTSWFHTRCCLPSVSVSKSRKENFAEQCKVLWKYVFAICYDYCNYWTHSHTTCPV